MRHIFSILILSLLNLVASCATGGAVSDTGLAAATRLAMDSDRSVPIEAFVVDTATQVAPKDLVLEGANPNDRHSMSYPSFVLRWPATQIHAERLVLIDAGFDEENAQKFGDLIQSFIWSADPIEFHGNLKSALGTDADKVELALFTHLHNDHVVGLATLCNEDNSISEVKPIVAFLSGAQADFAATNDNTKKGFDALGAMECVERIRVDLNPGFTPVDTERFPGLYVMRIAGHTDGTQVLLARTTSGWMLFVGDVVNATGGYASDVDTGTPKPFIYRTLLVKEDEAVLQGARRDLQKLLNDDVTIVVSHDTDNLSASGLTPYPLPLPTTDN